MHRLNRDFLATGLYAPGMVVGAPVQPPQISLNARSEPKDGSTMIQVDFRKLVSRADLACKKPASRSEDGMPLGNGPMGGLVWSDSSALKFQPDLWISLPRVANVRSRAAAPAAPWIGQSS